MKKVMSYSQTMNPRSHWDMIYLDLSVVNHGTVTNTIIMAVNYYVYIADTAIHHHSEMKVTVLS